VSCLNDFLNKKWPIKIVIFVSLFFFEIKELRTTEL